MRARLRHALLALVCWLPFSACMCGRRPGAVSEDTPQGQALKRIKEEGREIPVQLDGKALPIELGALFVEESNSVVAPFSNGKKNYRALLPWKLTVPSEKLSDSLLPLVRKSHPDAKPGTVKIALDTRYEDESNNVLDRDTWHVAAGTTGNRSDKQVLKSLGKSGIPARVVVRPLSFDWVENALELPFPQPPAAVTVVDGSTSTKRPLAHGSAPLAEQKGPTFEVRTPLNAPPNFPFKLEVVQRDGPQPTLKLAWKKTGSDEALRKLLAEGKAAVPARPAQALIVWLRVPDEDVRKERANNATLLFSSEAGEATVFEGTLPSPLRLTLTATALKWDGRTFTVPF
jgi:hypothetical protein